MLHPGPHGSHRHVVDALEVVLEIHSGHPGAGGKEGPLNRVEKEAACRVA